MTLLRIITRIQTRVVLAALVGMAILHIVATLAAPYMATASGYQRLQRTLPLNSMMLLPPVTPTSQPLPYAAPDSRYAMCRFETAGSPVVLNATLGDVGWTLALYTPEGQNIYVASGQAGQQTEISLRLVPSGDRFAGLTPEARGLAPSAQPPLSIAAPQGIAILRAPDRGLAFRGQTEAILRKANCAPSRL